MAIFDGLADHEVDRIKNTGTHLTLPANWSPISERTAADKAYIILAGEASVRRKGEEVATIGAGDIFGEGGIVLTDAVLGQKQSGNSVSEYNVLREAVLTDAVKNNTGIISVNQSAGSLGNQANVVAIGVAVQLTTPGG